MLIKAIVFDMDDTLYKEKDYVVSGFKAVDDWIKEKHKKTEFYDIAMRLFNSGERKQVFNKTLEKLNIDYDEKLIGNLIEQYRCHKPDIQLLEEADWVLNNLINSVKIGLISDGYLVAQERKINALKLKERVHSIILTDKLGKKYWKPSEIPYKKISRELQVPHQQCVYIGDNISKDFITAKKLKWLTVHINRKDGIYHNLKVDQAYKAHYTIDNLKRLTDIPVLKHMFLDT
ncbi:MULTISPECIES: HAD family hydrolase [Bacillus]|uniref:2-haloalkanoic acid dehalogenase n=1 Tax=Bacillus cereus TaxID=1396 RepID=A0A162P743_BACCE|nr:MULTISPECIES: HAD family hydrolase [Bacillus]KZD68364.1 2-haloalkanoic acid dehalogenase [Bacillus cereus]TSI02841.1 HAD family hydrolase [Bacillus sp. HY001]